MELEDEIKVVKADIRRLKNRWAYLEKQPNKQEFACVGYADAIATLEKYLKKKENGNK